LTSMSATGRILRLAVLLILLALAAGAFLVYRLQHPGPVARPAAELTLNFAQGTPTAQIFRQLAENGVVSDARLAEIYYRVYRAGSHLQAGEYRFSRPMPIDDVINRMAHGDVVKYAVIVPEGLTAEETFQLFWKQGIGGPEAFEDALRATELLPGLTQGVSDLEGFLFPNTYVVTRSTSARQIIDRMVDEFRRNFTPEMREQARTLNLTPRQAVTLASIVEKESALEQEGPVIASVYLNRLKRGMHLQADPTVIYALKRDGHWTGVLHRSDYGYDSPYNSYLYGGLPPGPICSPGLKALKAALNPARTDFLYFVADDSGGHTFSRTFEEHLQAIAGVRRQRAEASGEGAASGDSR
jgi:peptidoglycan lytic transglycosylase G